MRASFVPCVLGLCLILAGPADAGTTIQQALREGCYPSAQLKASFDSGMSQFPPGSVTHTKLESNFPPYWDGSVTKSKVTAPDTWVYRGYGDASTNNWHTKKLLAGILYSKAQNSLDQYIKRGGTPQEFWETNGPKLDASEDDPRRATFLMLRLLAIKTSDTPPSQFVSVALDFDTATAFGDVVYAFQVNPNSSILGLRDCKLGGEDQFQILGGTHISNLYRKRWAVYKKWEKYNAIMGTWEFVDNGPP